jgi:hypothetical protein
MIVEMIMVFMVIREIGLLAILGLVPHRNRPCRLGRRWSKLWDSRLLHMEH